MVDEVDDIIEMKNEAIQQLDDFFGQSGICAIQSVGKIEDKLICMIQVSDLMKDMVNNKKKEVSKC